MQIGDRLFGRIGTPYEGVQARIDNMTSRYVQLFFDRVVQIDGMNLLGQVLSKAVVRRYFDDYNQLRLFDL
jgi:hypothetical protein